MKKLLIILALLIPSLCSASYVGYYKMDGNSNDYSSTGNNGTDNTVSYYPGKVNQGGSYTGTTPSCTTLVSTSSQRVNPWTYSYAVKFKTLSSGANPVSFVSSQGGSGTWGGFEGTFNNTSQITMWNFYSGTQFKNPAIPVSITTGKWYSIAFTNDGTNMKMYKDGVIVTTTLSGGSTYWTNVVYPRIGCGGYSTNYFYLNGMTDEYIIENTVQNAQAIKTRYQYQFGMLE